MELLTLYRPVVPKELALIEASGWREFPPRLQEQPIFYITPYMQNPTLLATEMPRTQAAFCATCMTGEIDAVNVIIACD